MKIPFVKYHGAGNDFILIDNRSQVFPLPDPDLVSSLCHRSLGIGADGLILLQNSAKADFQMRIFNADGSEPTMCGNGLRCLVALIRRLGLASSQCSIEVGHSVFSCHIEPHQIGIYLGHPTLILKEHRLSTPNQNWKIHVVDTGVPHGVVFVEDLAGLDVESLARPIRFHPQFSPAGINVNFAQVLSDGSLLVRTYERGVGETISCGTGAAAVGWIASQLFSLPQPVSIYNLDKTHLLQIRHSESIGIELWGPAECVFEGAFDLDRRYAESGLKLQ